MLRQSVAQGRCCERAEHSIGGAFQPKNQAGAGPCGAVARSVTTREQARLAGRRESRSGFQGFFFGWALTKTPTGPIIINLQPLDGVIASVAQRQSSRLVSGGL